VIEAESLAVPNTLPKHNFQAAFKKWQKNWEPWIHIEGNYSEADGSQ
jgi:hypothetical protein